MSVAGIQISSLKAFLQTPEEARRTFRRLAAMGCRVVQLQWLSPSLSPRWVADALAEAGLTSVSTQDFTWQVEKDWDTVVEMNRLCGSRHVCISGVPGEKLDRDACEALAETSRRMVRALSGQGMVLSFHPRSREFAPMPGCPDRTVTDWLLEQVPEMMLGLDAFHAVRGGQDVPALLRRYEGRVDFVHCKDFVLENGAVRLRVLGEGCVDWPPIVAACRETGVPWVFAEQETFAAGDDPFACMARSFAYLQACGLQAGM